MWWTLQNVLWNTVLLIATNAATVNQVPAVREGNLIWLPNLRGIHFWITLQVNSFPCLSCLVTVHRQCGDRKPFRGNTAKKLSMSLLGFSVCEIVNSMSKSTWNIYRFKILYF